MLCPWCHLPLWVGKTFSVKITFSVPLLLCVLQEAREGLREAMAKDVVALNAELSASHDEKVRKNMVILQQFQTWTTTCCFQHLCLVMDVNGSGYVLSLAQALTAGYLVRIT